MTAPIKKLIVIVGLALSLLGGFVVQYVGSGIPAKADYNAVINYQGKLTNGSYVAVPDGDYNMEFKLYDALGSGSPPTGGTLLWTETRTGGNKVHVANGLFNVMLGEVNAFGSLDFNQTLYLSVNIGGTGSPGWDGEMSPRKKVGTVPSAFVASNLRGTGTIDITNTSSPQETLSYDGSNKLSVGVASDGFTTLTVAGTAAGFNLTGGNVGIGTTGPDRKLDVLDASNPQLRLTYTDGSVYTDFKTNSGGELNIQPSGNLASLGGGSTQTALRWYEASGNGTDYAAIRAPASVTSSYTWTLPASDGSGCLQSNGTGTISIAACGTSGITIGSTTITSGTTTRLLYDNGGVVGELATLDGGYINYNTTNLKVTSSQLNTIQDIATSSTPQFARLGLGAAADSAALYYGSLGSGQTLLKSVQGASETSGVNLIDLATTWNNGSNTPTGIKLNVTDTASNANSLLLDIGTGGGSYASKFKVTKAGNITAAGTINGLTISSGTISSATWNGNIITSAYGGTGNGFTKFTGPTSSEKTFTLPDSSATLLYSGGALGTPSSGVATNLTGTASGLTAGKASNLVGGNSSTQLGSIPYQSDTDTTTLLGPNTTSTKKFLSQTGTGTNGAVPAWTTLSSSDVGLGNVENTALSTWAGSTNITTLGTIATGTWSASTIAVNKGGTGQTSYTDGQLLIGNTTGNTLTLGTISNTSNQTTVTNGHGTIQIGTVQDIGTGSTPQFARLGLGAAADASKILTISQAANAAGLTVTGSSSETGTDLVTFTNAVLNPSSGSTNSILNLTYTNSSTIASPNTSTIAGLTLTPTLNVSSGTGTHNTLGINLGTVATNTCSAGTCPKYAIYAPSSNNWTDLFNYNGTSLITAAGLINAAQLTGTVPSGSLSGSYSSVTGVGTLGGLTVTGTTSINTSGSADTSLGTGTNSGSLLFGNSSTTAIKLGKFTTQNGVLFVSATDGTVSETAASTGSQCLVSASAGAAPTWSSCSGGGGISLAPSSADTTSSTNSAINITDTGIASNAFINLTQGTSTFSGTGLKMNFATSGSFTGKYLDFQSNGTTKISLGNGGTTGNGATAIAGLFGDYTMNNSVTAGSEFGNRFISTISGSTAASYIGNFFRMVDNGTGSGANHKVRGLEVQAFSGSNLGGINTGIASYGYTFGIEATTTAQAGAVAVPAAVLADLDNGSAPTVGNAIRAYTDNATSANLVDIYQTDSAFTGTGLIMELGKSDNTAGSFTGNFLKLQNAGTTKLTIGSDGAITSSGSASANIFQIQDSSGTNVANVNTLTTPNLIYNSNFEINANGWSAKGSPTTVAYDDTASNAKFNNGTLLETANEANTIGVKYSLPLKASTQYSFTIWAKTASSTVAGILGRQENGSDVETSCVGFSITTTWTQFSCTFTTGSTINSTTNIYVRWTGSSGSSRTVYYDGAALIAASAGLTFTNQGSNFDLNTVTNAITLDGNASNEVSPWQLSPNLFPSSVVREQISAVNQNGFIYAIGGWDGSAAVNTVYYAQLGADGSVQTWTAVNTLPAARRLAASVVANGYMYVIGGADTAGTAQTTIYYAKMNNDGTVGTWQTNAIPLTAARLGASAVVNNGIIYIVGGCTDTTCTTNATNTIYYGKVNADGSISGISAAGALDSATNTLTQNRGLGTAFVANGYLYYVGGSGSSPSSGANTTVYYSLIGDSSAPSTALGSWSATTALPNARLLHSTVVSNGAAYAIGGCSAQTSGECNANSGVTTVYYASLMGNGTVGAWTAASNVLPAARTSGVAVNASGYIYLIGGCTPTAATACGATTDLSTTIYATPPRVFVGANLDLIGLTSQNMGAFGGGGSFAAGNGRFVGDLKVDGYADFNNGIAVDSAVNINAVSAALGQVLLNINNANSNSIFSIRHMNSTFGSLASGGAFVDNMSYIGQEFTNDVKGSVAGTTTATLMGDDNEWFFKASATGVTFSAPRVTNGIARLSFPTTTTVSGLMAAGGVAGTLNNIVTAANLPVIQMKIATTLNSATSDIYWGVENGTTAAPTANDTPPSDGFFFWNNNAAGGWQGMVRSTAGGTIGTVTCPGSIVTTAGHFAVGRIEVLDSTHVHFMIDNDASDGTNLVDCGTVSGTLPTASMAPFIENNQSAAQGATHVIEIDYARVWQDDTNTMQADQSAQAVDQPPVQVDTIPDAFDPKQVLADLMTQTDADAAAATAEATAVQESDFDRLVAKTEIVTPKITASGLTIDNIGALGQNISILSDTSFIGRPYFNSDTAGFAQIKKGDQKVVISFDDPYLTQPIVNASISLENPINSNDASTLKQAEKQQEDLAQTLFNEGVQYLVMNKTKKGFTIYLNKTAPQDITFSWTALAVKNAKISLSGHSTDDSADTTGPTDAGAVAGDTTSSTSTGNGISDITPKDSTPKVMSSGELSPDAGDVMGDQTPPQSSPPADSPANTESIAGDGTP